MSSSALFENSFPRTARERVAFRARWIFPVVSPPQADAAIVVENDRVISIGAPPANCPVVDLGNAAVIPGLINAHTHLEFSDLSQPVGRPGMPFPDWIRSVVALRREQPRDRVAAVRRGLAESQQAGVAHLGEIATPDWPIAEFSPEAIPQATIFLELLGLRPERAALLFDLALAHLAVPGIAAGISPHAPYTVSPELLGRICRLSAERLFPVAMHLAESPEELELLAAHSGPFLHLLQDLDAWSSGAIPRGIQPLDYLQLLATAARSLVIHGNFLAETEMDFIARHAERMSVVYCPRTHAFFRHGRYPLSELLSRGICVAIGTDSRASNPDLDLFEELKHIAWEHGDVSLPDVLRLGTLHGARALGIADAGAIAVGKRPEFTVVSLPDRDSHDPFELLFHEETRTKRA